MHFQIEYYNKMWKDWLAFDQLFYKTEEDAQKRIDEYKQSVPKIQTRIVQTKVLERKLKSKSKTKVQVEKV